MICGHLRFLKVGPARFSSAFSAIAHRPWFAVTLIGLLAFSGSSAIGLIVGIAEPHIHDEFSYLLAADTFASGRVTNPTHPMWVHFESIHIIHQPSYMSKYPPGQGLMLAAGQLLGGHSIVGAWMSLGFMCAAICWMLYAWVPPRWAFLGGVLTLINPMMGISGQWAQSYWGGAVAATGGALLLGGIRRIMRQPRWYDALFSGLGLAILANSRPYEGLIFSLPIGLLLFKWMLSTKAPNFWILMRRIVVPVSVVIIATGLAMGYYNFRVTGNVFRLPYQVHADTYDMAPLFLFQKNPPEPTYRHQIIRAFHQTYELDFYENQRPLPLLLLRSVYMLLGGALHSLNILAIPLVATFTLFVGWTIRNRWAFHGLQIYLVTLFGLFLSTYVSIHYLAPLVALNYYFVLNAMRLWQYRNKKIGRFIPWIVPLLALTALVISVFGKFMQDHSSAWYHQRTKLAQDLSTQEGNHLILVSYGPQHSFHEEWVYNKAIIDEAKIVWARQMDPAEDCKLINYFSGRHIWSLEINGHPNLPALKPYANSMCRDLSSP